MDDAALLADPVVLAALAYWAVMDGRPDAPARRPEADRAPAHGLAAPWLSEQGEKDAAVIASHWALSNERRRAFPFCLLAAQVALCAGDAAGTLEFTRSPLAKGQP